MVDSRKVVRDTEITLLVAALIVMFGIAWTKFDEYHPQNMEGYDVLGCIRAWEYENNDYDNLEIYKVCEDKFKTQVQ